jgi:teichuronic acid biosynthesis glycosyltransferase TuaC
VTKLRVLSLSTLYPHDQAPNFGVFVERQMQAVMKRGDVDLVLISPQGIPPFPLGLNPRYAALKDLPTVELRGGVQVLRPRFTLIPGIGARLNAGAEARAVLPLAKRLHAEAPFDLIDAQFFYPDGPAAVQIGKALGLPVSIKARGADIHHWGKDPATAKQVLAAGQAAQGLLAVSQGLADDMAALGIDQGKITLHRTGLDADLFRPYDRKMCRDQLGLPRDVPVLATVGALIPRKGQKFAIEALAARRVPAELDRSARSRRTSERSCPSRSCRSTCFDLEPDQDRRGHVDRAVGADEDAKRDRRGKAEDHRPAQAAAARAA